LGGGPAAVPSFLVLVVLELAVPLWAGRRGDTTWHPRRIAEGYALFTIILLGAGVFAATTAVVAVVVEAADPQLVVVSGAGLTVVAAL
jgi:low temperature requirement protein LtrA